MPNLLDETSIIIPLNSIKTKRTVSVQQQNSILTYAGPGNEGLDLLKWINNQITLGNIIVSGSDKHVKIQFQDESIDLGDEGTVNTIDFVGDAVTATRVGDTVTVTITADPDSQTGIQFQNEGIDLGVPGDVDTIDFTGNAVTASLVGNTLTVNVTAAVSIGEYDALENVRVLASGLNVIGTYDGAGTTTITIPSIVKVFRARLYVDPARIQAGPDAGGATNWICVKFDNTLNQNTSVTDMCVPNVQKCFYASGAPSKSNAYTIDIDNNPNVAVVDVGSNSITLRIWNLVAPNGAQLTFTGI